jgi:hypothetical protein
MVYSDDPSLAGLKILPQVWFCNGFSLYKATKVLIYLTKVHVYIWCHLYTAILALLSLTQTFSALIQLTNLSACQKYIWKAFKKRIFQYHNIFEYFVKSCQTRQASTDRWYFLDILSCICSIIAVFHASNIHMDLAKKETRYIQYAPRSSPEYECGKRNPLYPIPQRENGSV